MVRSEQLAICAASLIRIFRAVSSEDEDDFVVTVRHPNAGVDRTRTTLSLVPVKTLIYWYQ